MSSIQEGFYRSVEAGEDLSSSQYMFVTLESDGQIDLADNIADKCYGVLQTVMGSGVGSECTVKALGHSKVVAKEALAVGDLVGPATDGKAQILVASQFARGICVKAAGNENDLAEIELFYTSDDLSGASTITALTITDVLVAVTAGATLGFFTIAAAPVTQPAHNADPAAQAAMTAAGPSKTASNPAGATATDPAANAGATQGVYTAPVGMTDPPTKAEAEAEFLKIKDDLDEIAVDIAAGKTATDANNTAIDALIVDVDDIRTQLTAAIADIDDNNSEIDNLITDVGELDGGIDNNKAAIDAINADFATLGLTAAA